MQLTDMKMLLILLMTLVKQPTSLPKPTFQNVVVYSGKCTLYKRTLTPPNKVTTSFVSTAFAKVIINRTARTFNLYYNNKLMLTRDNYDSYVDGQQGIEGFSFDNGADANRSIGERAFEINVGVTAGSLGYVYILSNYKVN